jgi:hypothetical protein
MVSKRTSAVSYGYGIAAIRSARCDSMSSTLSCRENSTTAGLHDHRRQGAEQIGPPRQPARKDWHLRARL